MTKVTIVTGLWDIGRHDIGDFSRSWDHYLDSFKKLLNLDINMFVYVDPSDEALADQVELIRDNIKSNTQIRFRSPTDFPFYKEVQTIRRNPDWYKQADWLEQSPQAKLANYNPIVMSKFFMLNDVAIENPFNSKYFFWIDGGITNTVAEHLLDNLKRIPKYMESSDSTFTFLAFPYQNDTEVHGFKTRAFNEFCNAHAEYVCRGGIFGGTKDAINQLNGEYYTILEQTLQAGYMGTEENIHTILTYRFPDLIKPFPIQEDGLVFRFLEHLGTYAYVENSLADLIKYDKRKPWNEIKTSLYVLTFNSPRQFEHLCISMSSYDWDMLPNTRKILVDNSTDFSTYQEYQELCREYGFEHIKKAENLGICGGRQFIAEHFQESDSEYYMFFEDDMFFARPYLEECRNGFKTQQDNFFVKSLTLMHRNQYDFMKLTFSEFYGDNSKQWAWANLPEVEKERFFPGVTEMPPLEPTGKKRYKGLSVLEGPYYYCNWPAWFSRKGNQKIFLDTKWAHPHEQTWMSHVFQLQMAGKIKSAVLELSPIDHDRFDFYDAEDRKES